MTEILPVIVGPTAGGKTELAVELAIEIGGEVVSADSMQIYRGLDIGSGKATEAERRGVPHHLIDIVDPDQRFTVKDWLVAAERAILEIRGRGRTPVVVGGTNLYIKALLEGLFEGPEPDATVRAAVEAMPQAERRVELERVDPEAAARIHTNDERRTVRALEVFRQTGAPISGHQKQWDAAASLRPGVRMVGLDWPSGLINQRINARVKHMMAGGLLGETRRLRDAGAFGEQSREGLGYKQLLEHLEGRCDLEAAVERIKIETRRFAKNQRTWLRRLRATPGLESVWIDCGATDPSGWPAVALGLIRPRS
ncbi:MAG: tRNA (adenosine(37)-N6)-dimethylallyltransferase MiaA [Planctomycetota bacterium]